LVSTGIGALSSTFFKVDLVLMQEANKTKTAISDEILQNLFIIKMFLKPFARTVQLFFGSQKESGNGT
jgi:hypothetical protein